MKIDNRTGVFVVLYKYKGATMQSKVAGIYTEREAAEERQLRLWKAAARTKGFVEVEVSIRQVRLNQDGRGKPALT